MATPQTEIESKALELTTEALEAFCEDISSMFGVEMQCEQQEIAAQTVAELRKRFENLVAVNIVDSEGILNGTFQLIFDREGLFTLGGVMVMLPEKRILANRKDASADLAESMIDAVGEAGNLLVGSWERIFREELEGHGHFMQRLPAFIGKPWDKPQEKIGLADDEELVFIPYEMTIAPYPAFNCGVIFPKAIFESKSTSDSEDAAPVDDDALKEADPNAPDAEAAAEKTESEEPEAANKSEAEKAEQERPAAEETPDDEASAAETPTEEAPADEVEATDPDEQTQDPEAAEDKTDSEEPEAANKSEAEKGEQEKPAAEEAPAAETPDDEASAAETPADEAPAGEVEGTDQDEQTQDPEAAEDKTDSEEPGETQESASEESERDQHDESAEQTGADPETDIAEEVTEEQSEAPETNEEPAMGPVSGAIKELAQSSVSPDEPSTPVSAKVTALGGTSEVLWVCAQDIMQHQVIWASPDDTVEQALTKLQQHDVGYLAVGSEEVLEGIVSKADVAGAMSPYLRSMFAKWRGPSDDATLKIKLKWIMSRPVRTARLDTPLATALENMCRFGGRVLPVMDEQGKVQGLLTVFDIFQMLLNLSADVPTAGKAPQGPPL